VVPPEVVAGAGIVTGAGVVAGAGIVAGVGDVAGTGGVVGVSDGDASCPRRRITGGPGRVSPDAPGNGVVAMTGGIPGTPGADTEVVGARKCNTGVWGGTVMPADGWLAVGREGTAAVAGRVAAAAAERVIADIPTAVSTSERSPGTVTQLSTPSTGRQRVSCQTNPSAASPSR
jgi:hypothetical protein